MKQKKNMRNGNLIKQIFNTSFQKLCNIPFKTEHREREREREREKIGM
jgi:hypothetical protein